MKRNLILGLFGFLILFLAFKVYPAIAAKPLPVIEMSNGYPSGPHFNLNIHETSSCQTTEGGNSIFISEYGDSTIQCVKNRKSSVIELIALDTCAEEFDGDAAKVQEISESKEPFLCSGLDQRNMICLLK